MAGNDKRAMGFDMAAWQAGKVKLTLDGAGSWVYVEEPDTIVTPVARPVATPDARR